MDVIKKRRKCSLVETGGLEKIDERNIKSV
jgi:hypothetical protein